MYNTSNATVNSTQHSLFNIVTTSHTQPQIDEPWFFWLRIILITALMIAVVIGNTMVLYCLFTIRELHTVTGEFLTNLAITDLGVGLISLPLALASSVKQVLVNQRWFCVLQGMTMILFVIASLLTLGVLSLAKYINAGYSVQKRFKKRHARGAIAGIWTMAAMFAIMPAIGFSKYNHRKMARECTPHDNNLLGYTYAIIVVIMVIIMPTITMLYCYGKLYMRTHLHLRRMRVNDVGNAYSGQPGLSSVESKMINTLIIMVIAFFLCWTPLLILYLLSILKILISNTIDSIFVFCVLGNSAVNPVLYAMRQRDFQRGFRQIFRRFSRLQLGRP